MAFKPYRSSEVLNLTDAGKTAVASPPPDSSQPAIFLRAGTVSWMLIFSGLLLLSFAAGAQSTQAGTATSPSTSASSATAQTKRHVVRHSKRHRKPAKAAGQTAADQAIVTPAAPPPPVPPAEQAARAAKVTFSQGNLSIDAENASLIQILGQVSHQTGMVVEGLGHDERIYGQYGPGTVASTLTKLLDGAGYDYVIIGGGGDRPPTKLSLTPGSAAGGGAANPATAGNSTPTTSPAANSEPANASEPTRPKTPQEIFEELRRMHPQ